MIILSPRLENYQFSQLCQIFFDIQQRYILIHYIANVSFLYQHCNAINSQNRMNREDLKISDEKLLYRCCRLTFSSIDTHFNTSKKKNCRRTLWKNVKLLKMNNFTFFHNVFYPIRFLNSYISHISVVVCSFFEFGTVSKWCIREWVKQRQ